MAPVLYLVTVSAALLCASMMPPALLSLAQPQGGTSLLLLALLGLAMAALSVQALSGRVTGFGRAQGLLALVAVWFVLPFIATLPFLVVMDMSFAAALFEATSGLTTTAATVLGSPSTLPREILLWRANLQWIGGYLTLAGLVHILAPAGVGGLPRSSGLFFRQGTETMLPGFSLDRFRRLFGYYCLATLVLTAAFVMAGIRPLDGLMLAMTALSTGGFVPYDGALEAALGPGALAVLAIGLLLGGTSLLWQRSIFADPRRTDLQNYELIWITVIVLLLSAAFAAVLFNAAGSAQVLSPIRALGEGFFAAVSLVTTSGLETRPGVLAVMPEPFVLFVVLAGASAISTAGGIKLFRLAGLLLQASKELSLLVFPSSIAPQRISGITFADEALRAIWNVFIATMAAISAAAFLLCIDGFGFQAGLTAAVALFANAGPVYGAMTPLGADAALWPSFADMGALGIGASVATMILGRLEVLVIFAALDLRYWLNR